MQLCVSKNMYLSYIIIFLVFLLDGLQKSHALKKIISLEIGSKYINIRVTVETKHV